jgi:hypothetical protein
MKTQIHQRDNGNILVCALCTIVIVSLIGANVLVNCITHYNVTAKQLKGWKEALYAAEAGGDAGFDEVRKALNPISLPFTTDGWAAAPSPAPTPGPAWIKTISGFGQEGNLSTTVTIDKLFDTTGTIPSSTPYYRIRAVGTARLFGLPRVGLRTPPAEAWATPSCARSILSTIILRRVMATVTGIILVCRRLHFPKLHGVSNWLPFRSILFLVAP